MRVDVVTIFPGMFDGVLNSSMLRIARQKGVLDVRLTDLREFTSDAHRTVDDRPYGGGPGMVMKVEPVVKAVRSLREEGAREGFGPGRLLLPCPRGKLFGQEQAEEWSRESRLIFVAAHYEGYDERIVEILGAERFSLGDFILTGGELPTMCAIDAVARLLPGVLGDSASIWSESFSPDNRGLLEYPQYTRPEEFEGLGVPEVLRSGAHERIAAWRAEQARLETGRLRPDLLERNDHEVQGSH